MNQEKLGAQLIKDAWLGDLAVLKDLIAKGADVHVKNRSALTLLHIACKLRDNLDCIQFLVEQGVDVHAKTENGQVALHFLAEFGDLKGMQYLIDKGVDLDVEDNDGISVIAYAADRGSLESIKMLRQHGANTHVVDSHGNGLLHFSAFKGHYECVVYLIETGLDPQLNNKDNKTALDCAKEQEYAEIVALIERYLSNNQQWQQLNNVIIQNDRQENIVF